MNLDPAKAMVRVEARCVSMALPFRAYEDLRYYLNGVAIHPSTDGGVNVLATDGHALGCIHDSGGRAESAVILSIGKGQRAALNKGGFVMVGEDRRPWITDAHDEVVWISPNTLIEGKFPDVAAIVGRLDDYQEGMIGTFNPELIRRVREVYPKRSKYTGVRFFHRSKDGKLATLCTLGKEGFALVMPMRDEPSDVVLKHCIPADYQKAA